MRNLSIDDVERAAEWGLRADFLESKTDSSVLICICQSIIEKKECSNLHRTLLTWGLDSGAQLRLLEGNSVLLFQLAGVNGAFWLWDVLFKSGYTLDKVIAKISNHGGQGKASRVTTKLGLLCSAPYCLSPELGSLINLLIHLGVDPNERDSDGYAPLGRLNEQLRLHEANSVSFDGFVSQLVAGVEVLISHGAEIEGILPTPEAFAAKAIQECIRSKREHSELLHSVQLPDLKAESLASRLVGGKAL